MNPAAAPVARRDWLGIAAGAALLVAFVLALLSPPDRVQGDLTRMLYIHVPTILTAYLAFIVTTVATIAYLATRRLAWDRVAASSAEVGLVFLGLAILTGMIWAFTFEQTAITTIPRVTREVFAPLATAVP